MSISSLLAPPGHRAAFPPVKVLAIAVPLLGTAAAMTAAARMAGLIDDVMEGLMAKGQIDGPVSQPEL